MSQQLKYIWKAVYSDGTYLDQIESDGTVNKYPDIDRSKLTQFIMVNTETDKTHIVLHLREGQKLIHRRRVSKRIPLSELFYKDNPERSLVETVWLVGWHENKDGVNVQMLIFLFEDGSIEFMDKWREDHALYKPINLIKEER